MFSGSIGSILIGVALLVLVLLVLARPFWQNARAARRRKPLSPRERLTQQKEALLLQIHTLDFDHETGKMPDEVYQAQREPLVQAAADILKQIDALDASPRVIPVDAFHEETADMDDPIEAAIARRRQQRQKAPAAANGRSRARFCPNCGQPVDSEDKFCTYCGHQLQKKPQPSHQHT